MHYLLDRRSIGDYCRKFNALDQELYCGDIPNKDAGDFLLANVPGLDCPDPVMQEIWHFRWWSFRKHIRSTPFGRVILEFMPDYDIVGGYGDLYLWAQRAGMAIESSREVQFIQDNTVFRGKERADGMPIIAGAFVAINVKNTDVTTEMAFAGDVANTLTGILLPATATVASGSTLQLSPVLVPFGVEGSVTYASATTSKATVSSTGLVTGVASGSSVITVSSGSVTATCTVTVTS